MKNDVYLPPGVALSENCFMPPAGDFLPITRLRKERASGGPLFPAAFSFYASGGILFVNSDKKYAESAV